jgi:hypothetical protein
MPADMHISLRGVAMPGGPTKTWAQARGPVLVNPFVDPNDPADAPKLRQGRILGGGEVTRSRPVQLELRQPAYDTVQVLQRRINQRFGGKEKVAHAKSRAVVELTIPRDYRDDFQHFLRLVLHLPLRTGTGADELLAERIAEAIQQGGAEHDELAVVWEAIGEPAKGALGKLYTSTNAQAAFHAARTGLRLHDNRAADVMIRFAQQAGSPVQTAAIRELARHRWVIRSLSVLRRLLEDESAAVRVAAYESLARLGDGRAVRRVRVGEQFVLDLVPAGTEKVIYATQTGEAKVVIFGRDVKVHRPVFFSMPDKLVTVNARAEDETLTVFRKVPYSGRTTPPFRIDFSVASLVRTLGEQARPGADGKIVGLNLTYGQVVSVLHNMCKEKDIPAKFILQPQPAVRRIYQASAAAGSG